MLLLLEALYDKLPPSLNIKQEKWIYGIKKLLSSLPQQEKKKSQTPVSIYVQDIREMNE